MTSFNIHLSGFGGQGIRLLSKILLRAADHAGLTVKGVDTYRLVCTAGRNCGSTDQNRQQSSQSTEIPNNSGIIYANTKTKSECCIKR